MKKQPLLSALMLVLSVPVVISAQNPLPSTQPTALTIYREEVKYGHIADHETTEAGWPAAYAKAKSPYTYLAVTSISGASEAWFIAPYANWKAMGESMKMEQSDPVLAAELARLSKADAEHVSNARSIHLAGRADLSAGTFPSVAKNRFYEITFFRVRAGHEREFEEIAKVFKAAYEKNAPTTSYRMYQVVAGMPGPTYMGFFSVQSMAELDAQQATDMKVMGGFTPEQMQKLQKFSAEGMINTETQRFAVNGRMSYVDDATAAQDPGFWRPGVKARN